VGQCRNFQNTSAFGRSILFYLNKINILFIFSAQGVRRAQVRKACPPYP